MQRRIFKFLVFALVAWLVFGWGMPRLFPGHQLAKAERDVFTALERARRSLLEKRLDPAYADQWGLRREEAVDKAMEMSRQFLTVTITATPVESTREGTEATRVARIRLEGRGGGAAPIILRRVNALEAPFTFHWTRDPWKPWSWRLTEVSNPELRHLGHSP